MNLFFPGETCTLPNKKVNIARTRRGEGGWGAGGGLVFSFGYSWHKDQQYFHFDPWKASFSFTLSCTGGRNMHARATRSSSHSKGSFNTPSKKHVNFGVSTEAFCGAPDASCCLAQFLRMLLRKRQHARSWAAAASFLRSSFPRLNN